MPEEMIKSLIDAKLRMVNLIVARLPALAAGQCQTVAKIIVDSINENLLENKGQAADPPAGGRWHKVPIE